MNNQIEQAINEAIALYWHNISTMQQILSNHNMDQRSAKRQQGAAIAHNIKALIAGKSLTHATVICGVR